MRKTKIVCTLGPASSDVEMIKKMILSGMNVARFNFSHSTHEEHLELLNKVFEAVKQIDMPVATMLDTKGPELRLGKIDGTVTLIEGETFTLLQDDIVGNKNCASINYKELYKNVKLGDKILLNDGLVATEVTKICDMNIECKILNSGEISSNKSINTPGVKLSLPSLTQKDKDDIIFGINNGFDFIAASFIRNANDVIEIKNILNEHNANHIKIIAKIENAEGVNNIDEILEVVDGVMVARGDLGVEIPMEQVPIIQKELIKKSYRAGKPVITATQMLESMIQNPHPTRAEVSDVANAVYDGTSAVMLSAESAVGKYPCECIQTMDKIATEVEKIINYWKRFGEKEQEFLHDEKSIMNYASCLTAMHMNTKALLAFTLSGGTARLLSKFRPDIPIYAITPDEITYRQLALSWGVQPIHIPGIYTIEEAMEVGINKCLDEKLLQKDDMVVISGGYNDNSSSEGTYRLNKVLGGILRI